MRKSKGIYSILNNSCKIYWKRNKKVGWEMSGAAARTGNVKNL